MLSREQFELLGSIPDDKPESVLRIVGRDYPVVVNPLDLLQLKKELGLAL